MDSVSQAALGAVVCHAVIGPSVGRRALVLGGVLGTLPDLDVLVRYVDAVDGFTRHRSFSHSLFVLSLASPLVALAVRRLGLRALRFRKLCLAVWLVLVTHPLLDAFTVYGTQIWWPLDRPPSVWGSLFIIDPLVTLPLLVAILLSAWPRAGRPVSARSALRVDAHRTTNGCSRTGSLVALALVAVYVGWTLFAMNTVLDRARATLAAQGYEAESVVALPLPLSLLWRVVAVDGDRYVEGYRSLLDPDRPIEFTTHVRGLPLLEATARQDAVARLRWFTRDRVKAEVDGDRLAVTDLRIGAESNYIFGFDVARRRGDAWEPIVAEARAVEIDASLIGDIWARMWDPEISLAPDVSDAGQGGSPAAGERPEP